MAGMFTVPEGFFWGAAASAHQVEGGNRNDWSEWEHQNAKRLAQIAKRREWPEYILEGHPNPSQEENYISGRATDHYHRFREDFDIARRLGHNAHRFSLEWSRIEPEEGKFDQAEIEHYREVIRALRERGMEPFATLWHFTLPVWFAKRGGWEKRENIAHFVRYCRRMASHFKGELRFFITLNEPSLLTGQAYLAGIWPPQKRRIVATTRVFFNLIRAHRTAYQAIKSINADAMVGLSENLEWQELPVLAPLIHYFRNVCFLDRVAKRTDFIGVNYYQAANLAGTNSYGTSDTGWRIYPQGLYRLIVNVWQRYRRPIFITENGIADALDTRRAKFIHDHMFWTQKAMAEGVDVRGYFHWSLLDNFEWDKGFWPRFGLVEVDYRTMERRIRQSAFAYRDLIAGKRPKR